MMNEKYNAPNSPCCGRPMNYAPANNCSCMSEPECPIPACIRKKKPDCEHTAVIPAITVESTDGLINYRDTLIHVMNNNTTYYVDDKGRPMLVWAGPVEYNNYDLDANPLKLREQILLDIANQRGAYYDRSGNYQAFILGSATDMARYAKLTLTGVEGETNVWQWQLDGAQGIGTTGFDRLCAAFNIFPDTQQRFYTEIDIDGYYVSKVTVDQRESGAHKYVRAQLFSPGVGETGVFEIFDTGYARMVTPI